MHIPYSLEYSYKHPSHDFVQNKILWHVNALLGNGVLNTFPQKQTRGKIERLLLGKEAANTFPRRQWRPPLWLETTWRVFCRRAPEVCRGQQRSFAGSRMLEEWAITAEKPSRRRVQELSAVERARKRMESVPSESWRLIEYRLG
jgi:hypothetical protein